ncbi:Hypothetical protein [Corynebacterium glutamicum ATCC 13032]|uniref:Uncharacterized protein n=1 Tax=Corynebacterium glutamicum (strain ATCC 13032 / DSM 20300 / JCM 1318 / BCRC 11384 / CCUG 27702 / LMG 3730 / NBRC 12168 / NCIMB 10025 / NRRL B-2784 / 534) TaxID=196627 RepID=Q8NN52_CORGL|nr:Hypothetical protein [Corynebacterium glutamicum ATCC 13032]
MLYITQSPQKNPKNKKLPLTFPKGKQGAVLNSLSECDLSVNSLGLDDVHQATVALGGKLDSASLQCEESVVATATNILTWVELGAALTNKDLACGNLLTTETLDAKALSLGITTVAGARCTLLVCHVVIPSF